MSLVMLHRCDRCAKESKDISGWYHIKITGSNTFPLEVDLCSDDCVQKWLAFKERPWNYI